MFISLLSCLFLLFGLFRFFLSVRGARFFLLFGWVHVLVFAVSAGGVLFFAVGAGACFIFCCLGGDGSSLTYRPAWLVSKGPKNKNTKQQKKHGFRARPVSWGPRDTWDSQRNSCGA